MGKKPKDWDTLFRKQSDWLGQFSAEVAIEIINQSIRNGWQGLFPLKNTGAGGYSGVNPRDQLRVIEEQISKHPANIESTYHRHDCSDAMKADLNIEKPASLIGIREHATVVFAEDAITIPGDKTVNQITQRAWYDLRHRR